MEKNELEKKGKEAKEKFLKAHNRQKEKLAEDQIKFDDCKLGHTYRIDARNFSTAIFYNDMFYGIRTKFHTVFIDAEIHWDKDEDYGTVRPQTEIEKTPDNVMEALKYYFDKNVDGKKQEAYEIVREYLERFIT